MHDTHTPDADVDTDADAGAGADGWSRDLIPSGDNYR